MISEANQKLKEYEKVLDALEDKIAVVDRDYRYLIVNQAFLKHLHKEENQVIGMSAPDIMGKDVFEDVIKNNLDCCFEGNIVKYEMKCIYPAIGERDLAVTCLPIDENSNVNRVACVANDITERKRAENALQDSEIKYSRIVNMANEGIWALDTETKTTYINQKMAEMLGYTVEEMVGKPVEDFMFEEDWADHKRVMINRKKGISETYERRFRHKNGRAVWTIGSGTPVFLKESGIKGSFAMFTDITKRKEAEEQLRHSQKMEAIGTLAGGIAHDFNNILTGIIGYGQIMKMFHLPESSAAQSDLEHILTAANRAKALVDQILTISRQAEQKKSNVLVAPLIKEVIKFLRASLPTTIEIRFSTGCNNGTIFADTSQIHQVLMNLCTNAAHAMKDRGGILDIRLDEVEFDDKKTDESNSFINEETIKAKRRYLKLVVSDTGNGISKQIIDRIFDPYFTTKKQGEGTGLGLAVVHGIVKNHDGIITVKSELNKGSTFEVLLPKTTTSQNISDSKKDQFLPKGNNEKILLVDDETIIVDMVKQFLENLGYDVVGETNSLEALRLFKEQPYSFDLVITDLTMPNMTGIGLVRELFQLRPDMPIILCSGFSMDRDFEKSNLGGNIRCFIKKPLDMPELAVKIHEIMDSNFTITKEAKL